ncbi:STM4014 family protein [Bradyrhizobium sp. HKCCYLS20291]|uniref:STM4014 family protein n=1 Tax=Bradyrhizobium sp. HKCCYLS20291 TaxID=3420766 RepID=UPI003EBFEF39
MNRPVAQSMAWQDQAGRKAAVIIGSAGDPRVASYQAARHRAGHAPALLIDYRELIADPDKAASRIPAEADVRIDSPGRAPDVLAGLLSRGIAASAQRGLHHLSYREITEQLEDRGRLLPPRQLFFGLMDVLAAVARRAAAHDGIRLVPDVDAIAHAFDKTSCHARLAARAIPVPATLPAIGSFEALQAAMIAARMPRVFLKLQHGSAAAGTVALATSKLGMRAVTTVETVADGAGVRLYNTRAIRSETSPAAIARLVDALAPHGLHVEAWVPKASIDGRVADLRVLVINGEPVFRVLRKSRHPMTNLHLGGERADATALLSRMSKPAVLALDATCRAVAQAFPGALQLGIDVAVATGFARHAVLEVNAFGDLLKGIATETGLDAYDLQLRALEAAA